MLHHSVRMMRRSGRETWKGASIQKGTSGVGLLEGAEVVGGDGRAEGECSTSIGNAGVSGSCHESIRPIMVDWVAGGGNVRPGMDNRVAGVMARGGVVRGDVGDAGRDAGCDSRGDAGDSG